MENKFTNKISDTFEKMYRKPMYKFFSIILGLPVILMVFIKYLFEKRNNEYVNLKKKVIEELEKEKTKENLKKEIEQQLRLKLEFFSQSTDETGFNKKVNELLEKRFDEIVEVKLNKELMKSDISKVTFISTFKKLLQNNAFLYTSIILGFPMYILIGIYRNPYIKYIFERLVMMIFVIFGVTFLVFTILHSSPLDPAINILGQGATPDQIKEFNAVYGLDRPYIVQLLESFKGLLTFDLGQSFAGNEEVFSAIARKFPVTLAITFVSLVVAVIIAIPAGIISAIKPYSAYDYIFMLIALIGLSIPNFWFGLILILNFSIEMNILPSTYVVGNASSMIMPAIVLGTSLAASISRMTRSSMLEVVKQDYMTTARAKGLSEKRVILKHGLGNAMIPIVTVIGLQFGGMLGGSAVTEKVFNINGIGSYIVDKQFIPDIPIVLAGVVYVAIIISIVNLLVDILYAFLDPRIKSKMKSY